MKPSIRKLDGCWTLTRPPYGFTTEPEVTVHTSWKAARTALLRSAPASAGASSQVGGYTWGLSAKGWPLRGTIRMEETGR